MFSYLWEINNSLFWAFKISQTGDICRSHLFPLSPIQSVLNSNIALLNTVEKKHRLPCRSGGCAAISFKRVRSPPFKCIYLACTTSTLLLLSLKFHGFFRNECLRTWLVVPGPEQLNSVETIDRGNRMGTQTPQIIWPVTDHLAANGLHSSW